MLPNENHPFMNPRKRLPHSLLARSVSVDETVRSVLERNQDRLAQQNITLEQDFASLEVLAYAELLDAGIEALLSNAIQAMPLGGELSISLIDHGHHWELEMADTFNVAIQLKREQRKIRKQDSEPTASDNDKQSSEKLNGTEQLPVLLPFPSNMHLRKAYDIAVHHGGQLQSWKCARGGTAYVLVIPNRERQRSRKAGW